MNILSPAQLRALTERQTRPAQRRVLDALGIPFSMRPDGTLCVSQDAVERVLNPGGVSVRRAEPDWSAVE